MRGPAEDSSVADHYWGAKPVGAPLMAVSDSRCLRHSSPADARAADGERGGAAGGKHGCLFATRASFQEVGWPNVIRHRASQFLDARRGIESLSIYLRPAKSGPPPYYYRRREAPWPTTSAPRLTRQPAPYLVRRRV